MDESAKNLTAQLERTVKLTGARWAIWMGIVEQEWEILFHSGLSKTRRKEIEDYLGSPATKTWMAGAMNSGRVRTRQLSESAPTLGCERIYFFPNAGTQSAIFIGGDHLARESQEFFKILALSDLFDNRRGAEPVIDLYQTYPMDTSLGASYDPEKIFNWILQVTSKLLPIDAAYLAVRVGDVYRIEAQWNFDPDILGKQISIYSSRELRLMQAKLRGMITAGSHQLPEFLNAGALPFPASTFLSTPILYGKRLIGLMVFASSTSPGLSNKDRDRAAWILERLAHAVENAIIFADLARYLRQSLLLSELASAATVESEPAQIARRLVNRLSRTFHTEQVAVLLVSPDGKSLKEFGSKIDSNPLVIPVAESLLGYVLETGLPYRTGDVSMAPRFYKEESEIQSLMAAPLKFSGRIIGVIGIESLERDAFTVQDEQLLIVVASQMAGIIENVRLMQEASDQARNLSLIHQVLGKVVGLVDIEEIAIVTASLVAQYFNYHLVFILVPDQKGEQLSVIGVGGLQAADLERGLHFPIQQGIPGWVFRMGESYYSNDVSTDPEYLKFNQWSATAELAVPLRSGSQTLGVVDCQRAENDTFTDDDLLIMESLAGILTSVIINARRYEERQVTITQLELMRESALDISNLELDNLIGRVVRRARQLVNAPGAELGLLELENNCVRVLTTDNPWYKLDEGIRPLGYGVTGRIAQSGKPLAVADYNAWDGRLFPEQPHPCTAVAGVPLIIKAEVIGTLIVMDDTPGRIFTEEDIHILELLAPQVAVSIRNARLYQELQERIMAQKRAERQLLQSARMAAVGEMAAGVAHELNNPLTTVSGFVELALEELPPDLPQRAELELVLAEAHRARQVVRRLLDFSRQSERQRLSVNPSSLLDDLLPLIQHQIYGANIQVEMECQKGMRPIQIDPNQVKQVLLNLVQNAIQAMPEGGKLKIAAGAMEYEGQPGTAFSIQDSGKGILPEHIDRLFEPFFTTRPVGSGTGLGLSVSYRIVTDHDGHILVDSQIGEGSIFRVWLPAYDPAQFEQN